MNLFKELQFHFELYVNKLYNLKMLIVKEEN